MVQPVGLVKDPSSTPISLFLNMALVMLLILSRTNGLVGRELVPSAGG